MGGQCFPPFVLWWVGTVLILIVFFCERFFWFLFFLLFVVCLCVLGFCMDNIDQ